MSVLQNSIFSFIFIHLHILCFPHQFTHVICVPIEMFKHTHTAPTPLPLPLCWNYWHVLFLCGSLPATYSTSRVCNPSVCWKRKHLTFCPLLLMCSHRISSDAEYGLTVSLPSVTCLLNYLTCFFQLCLAIPIYALQWIHSCCGILTGRTSARLTFNPKPGQVRQGKTS